MSITKVTYFIFKIFLTHTSPHVHCPLPSAGSRHCSPGAFSNDRLALEWNLSVCFSPAAALSKIVWLCPHQPCPHRRLLQSQVKGGLVRVTAATLKCVTTGPWPAAACAMAEEKSQRHLGLYFCSLHSALREAGPLFLSCFFNLSPAM